VIAQSRREQCGNGRFANPAEAERCHGDAELAAREIGFDVAHHPLQQTRAKAILLCHRVDAEAPAFYQREFGGNVKSVRGQQK
jgi:hypothetical protein